MTKKGWSSCRWKAVGGAGGGGGRSMQGVGICGGVPRLGHAACCCAPQKLWAVRSGGGRLAGGERRGEEAHATGRARCPF